MTTRSTCNFAQSGPDPILENTASPKIHLPFFNIALFKETGHFRWLPTGHPIPHVVTQPVALAWCHEQIGLSKVELQLDFCFVGILRVHITYCGCMKSLYKRLHLVNTDTYDVWHTWYFSTKLDVTDVTHMYSIHIVTCSRTCCTLDCFVTTGASLLSCNQAKHDMYCGRKSRFSHAYKHILQ